MKKNKYILKYKKYKHIDLNKRPSRYINKVKNKGWIAKHGFYPFIHFTLTHNRYKYSEEENKKIIDPKTRHIYYSSHIDRYIYQYYGYILNNLYNQVAIDKGIDEVAIAYRNNLQGKCNIHFAREVLEFIVKNESCFIFLGDFTSFFDKLEHRYLKSKVQEVLKEEYLPDDHFAVYKSITRFSYIEKIDIEEYLSNTKYEWEKNNRYFDTKEFHKFKKYKNGVIKTNENSYGIPQGSAISAIYANIYMIDFDEQLSQLAQNLNGIYRRYSDDMILVIPMNKEEIENKNYSRYEEEVHRIKESIPNLILNPTKTERFIYCEGKLNNLNQDSDILSYLGFDFDGNKIRDKSIFKFYTRLYAKIRVANNKTKRLQKKTCRKKLYRLYSHLGSHTTKSEHGNFLTYANKAKKEFEKSECLDNIIDNQIKNHWKKIRKKLL